MINKFLDSSHRAAGSSSAFNRPKSRPRLSGTGGSGREGEGDRTSGDGWEGRSLPPAQPGRPMTAVPAGEGPAH